MKICLIGHAFVASNPVNLLPFLSILLEKNFTASFLSQQSLEKTEA
jgi:hypothetical protein